MVASGVTRVSCARGQKQRSALPPPPSPPHPRCHVVSVSIGADVRKILRGPSTLSIYVGAERVRSEDGLPPPQLTKGCGERRKLPGEVWGEVPVANGFFGVGGGSIKHILGHKCE